jgi:hypothetical protein
MQDKIQEMADDIYKNSNYSATMSFEIAKFNVKNNYRKCGGDTVILTKDEFHSMIKTDKEAEEYSQQCWNTGYEKGRQEAAEKILNEIMSTKTDDRYWSKNESFVRFVDGVLDKCEKFAEEFNVKI